MLNFIVTLITNLMVVVVLPDTFRWMGVEELHRDPTVGPHPKVWTRGQKWKYSAEDGAPERLGCGTVKEEVSQILERVSAGAT